MWGPFLGLGSLIVAFSVVELSSITQGRKEREASGREKEIKARGFESIMHREGVLIIEGWKPRHLGSPITFASVCIT